MDKYQKALTNLHNRAMRGDTDRRGKIIRQTKLLQELVDNYERLEKALDKACERLEELEYYYSLVDRDYGDYQIYHTGKLNKSMQEWKEWCLNDD